MMVSRRRMRCLQYFDDLVTVRIVCSMNAFIRIVSVMAGLSFWAPWEISEGRWMSRACCVPVNLIHRVQTSIGKQFAPILGVENLKS